MSEKKKFILNCDVCDARKIKEENLSEYEQIIINADLILVDEYSRGVFHRLPIMCNADEMLDVEGDVAVICTNGNYEIGSDTTFQKKTVLCVNGRLAIHSGAEKAMENVLKICVNGSARYPESMAPFLGRMLVNGEARCIPDDCIELKSIFVIDKYFPLRARQDGKYYVERKVVLTDRDVDVTALTDKNVHFVTKRFLVREELVPQAVVLVEESVELDVVPEGFAYVREEAVLNEALVNKYGTKMYIDGDLTLTDGSERCFDKIEKLVIKGDVLLLKRQSEDFARVDASYRKLIFTKGRHISTKALIVVDERMLETAPDGVEIVNSAMVKVEKDVNPELIIERLSVKNCAQVFCSKEQKSALHLVCKNVAKISDEEMPSGEEGEDGEADGILGMLKKAANCKVVNADTYLL